MDIDVAIPNKRRLRRMMAWVLSSALRRAEPPVLMHMMKRLLLKRKSTFETTEWEMKYMVDESCNVEVATKERSAESDEFQYVDTASRPAVGSSGGVAYVIDKTLSRGTSGVDVSGIYRGTGHTGITITPSLSIPTQKSKE